MKKYLYLAVVLLVMALCVPGFVLADATVTSTRVARTAGTGQGISYVVGIADVSDGRSLVVDDEGSASVKQYPAIIATAEGTTLNTGTALVTGACVLKTITLGGPATSAGDYVLLYDNTSAAGTAKYEVTLGTAKGTEHLVIPGGATFATGIFADASNAVQKITITYDE